MDPEQIDITEADPVRDTLDASARFALHQAVLRFLHTAMDASNLASICGRPKLAALIDKQIEPFGGHLAKALRPDGKMGDDYEGETP